MGNFTQSVTGALNIELAGGTPGTGFDQVNVSGVSKLDGTLNVMQLGGYFPTVGAIFSFINSDGGTTGGFSNLTTPLAYAGVSVQYVTQFSNAVFPESPISAAISAASAEGSSANESVAGSGGGGGRGGRAAVTAPFNNNSASALMCLVADVEVLFFPRGVPIKVP